MWYPSCCVHLWIVLIIRCVLCLTRCQVPEFDPVVAVCGTVLQREILSLQIVKGFSRWVAGVNKLCNIEKGHYLGLMQAALIISSVHILYHKSIKTRVRGISRGGSVGISSHSVVVVRKCDPVATPTSQGLDVLIHLERNLL